MRAVCLKFPEIESNFPLRTSDDQKVYLHLVTNMCRLDNNRRKGHFKEILRELTAERITEHFSAIPQSVLDTLQSDLDQNQVSPQQIDLPLIKGYLKARSNQKYNQYYDVMPIIICYLKYPGKTFLEKIPVLTNQDYHYLLRYCDLFVDHWDQICLDQFGHLRGFSYNMVIRRLIQLINLSSLGYFFPELRSTEKEHAFDQIWALVCRQIGWPTPPQTLPDWAQTVIAKHWRRILAQRRYQRLRIGQELQLLPEIGIEYQLAKGRFEGLSSSAEGTSFIIQFLTY